MVPIHRGATAAAVLQAAALRVHGQEDMAAGDGFVREDDGVARLPPDRDDARRQLKALPPARASQDGKSGHGQQRTTGAEANNCLGQVKAGKLLARASDPDPNPAPRRPPAGKSRCR